MAPLLGPFCFVLLTAKAFIIISLLLEHLLEVWFTVDDAFQCSICSNTKNQQHP